MKSVFDIDNSYLTVAYLAQSKIMELTPIERVIDPSNQQMTEGKDCEVLCFFPEGFIRKEDYILKFIARDFDENSGIFLDMYISISRQELN